MILVWPDGLPDKRMSRMKAASYSKPSEGERVVATSTT